MTTLQFDLTDRVSGTWLSIVVPDHSLCFSRSQSFAYNCRREGCSHNAGLDRRRHGTGVAHCGEELHSYLSNSQPCVSSLRGSDIGQRISVPPCALTATSRRSPDHVSQARTFLPVNGLVSFQLWQRLERKPTPQNRYRYQSETWMASCLPTSPPGVQRQPDIPHMLVRGAAVRSPDIPGRAEPRCTHCAPRHWAGAGTNVKTGWCVRALVMFRTLLRFLDNLRFSC